MSAIDGPQEDYLGEYITIAAAFTMLRVVETQCRIEFADRSKAPEEGDVIVFLDHDKQIDSTNTVHDWLKANSRDVPQSESSYTKNTHQYHLAQDVFCVHWRPTEGGKLQESQTYVTWRIRLDPNKQTNSGEKTIYGLLRLHNPGVAAAPYLLYTDGGWSPASSDENGFVRSDLGIPTTLPEPDGEQWDPIRGIDKNTPMYLRVYKMG